MYASVVELFVIQWKWLIHSGVNEKSEWMKNNPAKYSIIWWVWEIWWIVWQNSLQIQIKFKFTKWFKWNIYTEKFYIYQKLYHIKTCQFNSIIFIGKWKINYFNLDLCLHTWKFRSSVKNSTDVFEVFVNNTNLTFLTFCIKMR